MIALVQNGNTVASLSADTAERVLNRDDQSRLPWHIELKYPISRPTTSITKSEHLLVAFLDVVKHRDLSLVSECLRNFAIANMKLIMTMCNFDTDMFCRKLVKTPLDVLKILIDVGDDGTYEWIPDCLLLELFFMLRDTSEEDESWCDKLGMTRATTIKQLSPQFVKYLYTETPIGFARKFGLSHGREHSLKWSMVSLIPQAKRARTMLD